MAASRTYVSRGNHRHRYFSGEHESPPPPPHSIFEFTEFDIWNVAPSPELQKTVTASRTSKKPFPATAPVDVPDWQMILKEEMTENRTAGSDGDEYDGEVYGGGSGEVVPPHEYLARGRTASFSVHEGFGRTLKGRDLSRVRNAVWKKIGFED
ncbi:putative senescence regulator S40 [Helianthus debilis subsp. tardiflorus]